MSQTHDDHRRNPIEVENGPDEPEGAERNRDVADTPEEEVRQVLEQQYRRQLKRGALGADESVAAIEEGTRREIAARARRLKVLGGSAADLDAATEKELGEYRRERQLMKMVGKGYIVADLRPEGAAGTYQPGTGRTTIDKRVALSPDVQDEDVLYGRHVCRHEEWHRKEQAKVFNADQVTARGRTFPLHPDLVEGQAVAKSSPENPQTDQQTDDYLRHAESYRAAAGLIGAERLDAAIKSGDIRSLQDAIAAEERQAESRAA
jgi:hypothetical protein